MESSYGVGVKNRFFLDYEYSDPSDISVSASKPVKEVNFEEKKSNMTPKNKKEAVKTDSTKAPTQSKLSHLN